MRRRETAGAMRVLRAYTGEKAWREDACHRPNGTQHEAVISAALTYLSAGNDWVLAAAGSHLKANKAVDY